MDFRNELKAFSDVQMTSKDGKTIVPALVRLVQNFQGKITKMFSDFREEFSKLLAEKDKKLLPYNLMQYRSKNKLQN